MTVEGHHSHQKNDYITHLECPVKPALMQRLCNCLLSVTAVEVVWTILGYKVWVSGCWAYTGCHFDPRDSCSLAGSKQMQKKS